MSRFLISTAGLVVTLGLVGTGAGTALAAESPSPVPSVSASTEPTVPADAAEEPADDAAAEDAAAAVQEALALRPVYTCDEDPSDDLQLPANGDGVTYALEDGAFTATLDEGYVWGEAVGWDPWTDPFFEEPPYLTDPVPGTTDPVVIPLADLAFPHCNHNDETTVDLSTECVDGVGYLVYGIDAWWASADTTVRVFPYTRDEALAGRSVYEGTDLSGRLAWDGSTPGMTDSIGLDGTGVDLPDVDAPIISLRSSDAEPHEAVVKVDLEADDPCLGSSAGDDAAAGGADGSDDPPVLAATGPEAAWLTAGVAALLVAAGAALVVARRRLRA